MALPEFTMRQLLEAGCHFGHKTQRWNPKMAPYIFGDRNKVHIMDLAQTVPLLHHALKVVSDTVASGGRVLFVGTKRQASQIMADSAGRCAQYYVNARWLGGMLTNWNTISHSIKRLRKVDEMLNSDKAAQFTKKERLTLTRERDKLERALGGIKDMGGTPDLLFIIDTNKESIAVLEANKLNIPVIAVLDSNCNPDTITHPIPGNDDASRAINLYCDLVAKAAIDGIERQQGSMGVDLGAAEEPVEAALAAEPVAQAPAEEAVAPATETTAPEPEAPATKTTTPVEVEEETPSTADDEAALFATPDGDADDLKKISGVGPVLESKLHALGITQYAQIAAFSAQDIEKVDSRLNFKGRIERDEWIKQAEELAG